MRRYSVQNLSYEGMVIPQAEIEILNINLSQDMVTVHPQYYSISEGKRYPQSGKNISFPYQTSIDIEDQVESAIKSAFPSAEEIFE